MLNLRLKPYAILSGITAVLVLIAAPTGLLIPGFYDVLPSEDLLPGTYAQDLIAIVVALMLLWSIGAALRGSVRGVVVWLGTLGYLIYGYLLFSFDRLWTPLYPAYLAILGLSLFSMIGVLGQIDPKAFRRLIDDKMPARRLASIFAILLILIPQWINFMMRNITTQQPDYFNSVIVIDLSFVIPAALVTAVYLWQRRDWGFVFAGLFLVKISTMGWSLVIGTFWAQSYGTPIDWGQMVVYLFIGTDGTAGMWRYLVHLKGVGGETAVR
jgi:hypothetical protein